jgi:hypothetical protein
MKIALYGNTCNNLFNICKALRGKGIDAHLYLNNDIDIQNKPESDEKELKNNYPDWIHQSEDWNPFKVIKLINFKMIKEFNKYDLVILSDNGLLIAKFLKIKKIFYVTGMDLTKLPFYDRYLSEQKDFTTKIKRRYITLMQKLGIKSCDLILTQPFEPFENSLEKLNVKKERISNYYYPILMDDSKIKYKNDAWEKIDKKNKNKLNKFKFIIFHPTRIIFSDKQKEIETGHYKGNEKLINAFTSLIQKRKIDDICLAMPQRKHSIDINEAKKLINKNRIENNVVWLEANSEEGFTREELVNYYSISDIVADEFGIGWFGSIVIEAALCKKVIMTCINKKIVNKLYKDCPIISCDNEIEIEKYIENIYDNIKIKNDISEKNYEWAKKYHSISEGINLYIDNFRRDKVIG